MHLLPDILFPLYDEKKAPPSSFFPWFLKVPICEIFDLYRGGGGGDLGVQKIIFLYLGFHLGPQNCLIFRRIF
jgi:hypothetical protein